jgi:hypothetical protein
LIANILRDCHLATLPDSHTHKYELHFIPSELQDRLVAAGVYLGVFTVFTEVKALSRKRCWLLW